MHFDSILEIIRDGSKTDFQKAADLHALLIGSGTAQASTPAKRGPKPRKPKPDVQPELMTPPDAAS